MQLAGVEGKADISVIEQHFLLKKLVLFSKPEKIDAHLT